PASAARRALPSPLVRACRNCCSVLRAARAAPTGGWGEAGARFWSLVAPRLARAVPKCRPRTRNTPTRRAAASGAGEGHVSQRRAVLARDGATPLEGFEVGAPAKLASRQSMILKSG